MPNYDYKCMKCEYIFERFHGINEEISFSCPECTSTKVERQISGGSGIHFKGSGFYVTDYKNKSNNPKKENTPSQKIESKDAKSNPTKDASSTKSESNSSSSKKEKLTTTSS